MAYGSVVQEGTIGRMNASTRTGALSFVLAPPHAIARDKGWTYRCLCSPRDRTITLSGSIDVSGEGTPNDLVLKVRMKLASGALVERQCEGLSWSEQAGNYFYPLRAIVGGDFVKEFTVADGVRELEFELVLWRPASPARYSLSRFDIAPVGLPDAAGIRWVLEHGFTQPSPQSRALLIGGSPEDAISQAVEEAFPQTARLWNRGSRVDRIEPTAPALEALGSGQVYELIAISVPPDKWEWSFRNMARLNELLTDTGRLMINVPTPGPFDQGDWARRLRQRFSEERLDHTSARQGVALTPFSLRAMIAPSEAGSEAWLALSRDLAFPAARRAMPELTGAILADDWVLAADMIERSDRSSPAFQIASAWLQPLVSNLQTSSQKLERAGDREAAAMLRLAMHRLFPGEERYAYEAIAHLRAAGMFDRAREIIAEARQVLPGSLAIDLQEALLCSVTGEPERAIEILWQSAGAVPGITPSFRRTMAMILRAYAQECQRAEVDTAHPQPLLLPEVSHAYNADPERFSARWYTTPFATRLVEDAHARRMERRNTARPVPANRKMRMLVLTSDNWQFLTNLLDRIDTQETDFEIRTFDFAFLEQKWSKEHLHELFAPVSMGLTQDRVWSRAAREDTTLAELVDWCDVVFCEWAGTHAIWLSRFLPPEKKLVVRLHSFEAFSQWPFFIDFGGVDGLMFVADHIREFAGIQYRLGQYDLATTVLPNFNPLNGFARPKGRHAARTLAMVGYSNLNKHPLMGAEILAFLHKQDPEWRLQLYGHPWNVETLTGAEREYHDRFWAFVRDNNLNEAVEIMPYTNDIPAALQDVGFILSCSWREGTHEAVLEGMATGCVPVIRRWPMVSQYGAPESSYPGITCFDTIEEAVAIIEASAAPADFERASKASIDYAMTNFDIEAVFPKFSAFMREVVGD
jgi:glycosyltransferase involved in cell wall biosynthesis